jgi:Fibronectin type III domain
VIAVLAASLAVVGTAGPASAASNTVRPATVPGAPVIRSALRGASGGARTAVARWWAPTSNGGSAIIGYRVTILRMSSAVANATVRSRGTSRLLGPSTRSQSFTLPGANYRFQVVAVNAHGAGAASARSSNVVPR